LRDPALHLPLDQHRLQHPAAIIDTGIGGKRRAPGGGVDLDLGDVDAVGEGRRGVKRAFRIEAVAGAVRQLEERDLAVGAGLQTILLVLIAARVYRYGRGPSASRRLIGRDDGRTGAHDRDAR